MGRLLLALLVLAFCAPAASIREVDFNNFSYPFVSHKYFSVPSRLRWMPMAAGGRVALHDGRYTLPCDDPSCYLLTFEQVTFGKITGVGEVAIATVVFHTGGTANWEYMYVVAIRAGKPQVAAWAEAGSRADMGLRRVSTDHGDLLLEVNDPGKREGDCCSTGSITFRYRWQQGAFRQIDKPVRADDPPR